MYDIDHCAIHSTDPAEFASDCQVNLQSAAAEHIEIVMVVTEIQGYYRPGTSVTLMLSVFCPY